MDQGEHISSVFWNATLHLPVADRRRIRIEGWDVEESVEGLILLPKPNLVVNTGINARLDRLFGINGPPSAVSKMGVDNGTVNPSATTALSADGNSTTRTIGGFDSAATRSGQVVSAAKTFTGSNVNFVMRRFFLSLGSTADLTNSGTADTSGSLHSMTNVMVLDLTGVSSWSMTMTAQVTGTGS